MGDEFPSAISEFAIGSQIAGYRLEEQIGRGGMAVVYRAYDPRLDRHVALKILAPGLALDEAFRQRFIRESRAAAAVDHPNIIPVFDAGEASGVLFIAMRFVHGRDVRTLLDAVGPLPAARAADIVSQVASALDAAHARGLVHRDVKPGNMLLDATAGGGRQDHVYLSDFGLSKQSLAQTALTSQGQFLGTLDYVAPEQVEGHPVDGRADEYALACATFELLSGTPPFKRDGGLAVVWAKLSEPPPRLSQRRPDLPVAVDAVMNRALAKEPADRFGTCGEFAAALRDSLGLRAADSGPAARPPASPTPTQVALPAMSAGEASAGEVSAGPAPPGPAPAGPPPTAAGAVPSVPPAPSAPAISAPGAEMPAAAASGPTTGSSGSSGPSAPSGPSWARAEAGPPTEAAQVPEARSTRPGLTEPSPSAAPGPASWPPGWSAPDQPDYRSSSDYRASRDYRAPSGHSTSPDYREASGAAGPGSWPHAGAVIAPPAPRPWWQSRALMAVAGVVVVIGVAGGAYAALHHSGVTSSSGTGGGLAAAIQPPGCSAAVASAQRLSQVRSHSVGLGNNPFGVVVTPDGRFTFVALGNEVAVLSTNGGSLAPAQVATVPASGAKKTEAITPDGQYVLAAEGSGAYVISAARAEAGDGAGAIVGTLAGPPGNPSNEVAVSADGKFAFITFQNDGEVAVFNLREAIAGGFGQAGFKGFIQLGAASEPQAMAQSPDGRWLYVTGESQNGRLYVVDESKAESEPQHALQSSAAAGCAPARVIVSADGTDVWVTDRDSNALVAFSAARLLSDPARSLIARVSVGQTPLGLSFVHGGNEIIIADADLRGASGADNLALISTQQALQGRAGAVRGFITTGVKPRELAVEPGGKTLLSTDFGSGQLQAIDLGSLP